MTKQDQEALCSAAAPTLQRIRDQAEGKPFRLRQMLQYVADELFSPKLNVNRLKEACGIRDNSVAIHFHAAMGAPPHQYMMEARLEVARRLLEQTDLPIWKISELLGYSSIQVFSRAFARGVDMRPTVYRRNERARKPEAPTSDEARSSERGGEFADLRAQLEGDPQLRALVAGFVAWVQEHRQ